MSQRVADETVVVLRKTGITVKVDGSEFVFLTVTELALEYARCQRQLAAAAERSTAARPLTATDVQRSKGPA